MKYYSQIGQDAYYIEKIINHRKHGTFLDVGAHDGIRTSNTYALETQLEWVGFCIEANPELARICHQNRPRSVTVQAAVWSEPKKVVFELPGSGNDFLSRIGGIEHNANYFANDFRDVKTIAMMAMPISQILGDGKHSFDYFSLDVEGAELEALKGIDWENTSFGFIALEFGHRQDFLKEIVQYLDTKGYDLHRINDFDADFTPRQNNDN